MVSTLAKILILILFGTYMYVLGSTHKDVPESTLDQTDYELIIDSIK